MSREPVVGFAAMTNWLGFLGAASLVAVGAWLNAPAAPVEVAPEPVVAAAPSNNENKPPDAPGAPGAQPQAQGG